MRSDTTSAMDEWMSALSEAQGRNADGLTTEEIARSMGCNAATARRRIKLLHSMGRAKHVGFRDQQNMIGTTFPVPVYQIIKAKKK